MKENDFIKNFAAQFDEADPVTINMNTKFRDIEGWSSFTALSIIAMIDEVYNKKITGNDIKNSVTVRDIYNLIINKDR